ncbi:hypothetical protein [Flavobacterium sp. WC2509]|uniref:hypothetical protein n=1 Tax=Flavobacterium sp. WC2509 TaxID=3461406 RepID=UPI004044214A
MKHLIYLLLFSTAVFSQNYNYAVKKTQKSISPVAPVANNQAEEIEYFNAYLLPLAQKANLQAALNTYRAVRLEAGNYKEGGLQRITLNSNMKLYGHSSYNEMPEINIAAGATNVLVTSVKLWNGLKFLNGAAITNCTISHVSGGDISATNASVENCTFIDIIGSNLNINNISSGYFRNNKIIKHWVTSVSPQLFLKGNNATPSTNNTWAWLNLLTAHGDATDIDNFGNLNVIGLDAEAWNYKNLGTGKALLYMRNMGDVKLASMAGLGYATNATPVFDIQANNLMLLDKGISTNGGASTTTAKTFTIDSNSSPYSVSGGNYDIRGHFNDTNISYNGTNQASLIAGTTAATNITSSILGANKQVWARPVFEQIGNPTGVNWQDNRVGKASSRAYIQNLIDTNGIANLPEGIFYIDSPLLINQNEGIVGSGTGKTAIVGLTDNFNLINVRGAGVSSFTLNYLTLQGGSKGVHITSDGLDNWFQPNGINFKYVVFRNQATYGIEVAQMYGMDNNMFDQVHFFNIPTAFKQTPDPSYGGFETNHMTYIDKTVFYNCQVINCGTGFSLRTARADNLNAWINCNFEGNKIAIDLSAQNAPIMINCNFKNNTGTHIIEATPTIGLYSCNFSNNTATNIIKGTTVNIEGCNFLDNIPLFETNTTAYIVNSTVIGSVKNMPKAVLVNSNIQSDSNLNYSLVNRVNSSNSIILNDAPKPYPQFLVTQ